MMPMELFVGGPADGQRINVLSDVNHYRFPVTKIAIPELSHWHVSQTVEIALYRREYIKVGAVRISVFLLDSMGAIEMVMALVEGYKGESRETDPVELAAAADLCESHGLNGVAEFLKSRR